FGEGDVNFSRAQFGEGDVDFFNVQFGEGDVNFFNARFGEGDVNFFNVPFGEGNVNFKGARFGKGNVNFTGARFGEGDVNFSRAQFGEGDVDFFNVQFGEGDVNFFNARFGEGNVDFESIKLSGQFNFMNATRTEHIKSLTFKFATFDGPVSLDGNSFNCVPDFTNTKLSHQLSLSHFTVSNKLTHKSYLIPKCLIILKELWFGSRLKYSQIKSALKLSKKLSRKLPWLSKATAADRQDIDRLRRLKELAESNKHHKLALDLHIEEMKSSRWIETTSKRALFTEFLFQKLGDYGRSIQRPLVSIATIGLLCSPIHYLSSTVKNPSFTDSIYYSFSQMLHLIPSSRAGRTEFATRLFESTDKIPDHIFLLSWFQSLTSIALVFLIGLALRNRFRI
ncbi:pentapeptide repeat-containing protein, partial [Pseudoalteromonas umbrosa]|uniref:pentapeptide repeat-containing protein n=1 Tax=Pseudoalteromonas umbrosa TaxID=3048489 RepID=UPI0024C37B46